MRLLCAVRPVEVRFATGGQKSSARVAGFFWQTEARLWYPES